MWVTKFLLRPHLASGDQESQQPGPAFNRSAWTLLFRHFSEGSNQGGSTSRESIHFLPISSEESPVQGRISTNYQPATLEQICRRMVLQNGGSSRSLFFDTTERFHDETRSPGRILFSPSSPRVPQIPTLCVQREDIRVPMSPIRVEISPRAFTRLMTPVIAHIRSLGIRIVIYLDDILILHQDPSVLQSIFRKVVSLLEGLGFLINLNKCSQFPSQQLIFLGTMLNTVTMSLSLLTEKLDLIQQGALQLRTKGKSTLPELAALLGRMSHAAQNGILLAPLHYRALQRVHSAGTLRYGCKGSKQSLDLSREVMKDVEWWLSQEPRNTNTHHLRSPPFDLVIHTDASLLGWGQQQTTPPSGDAGAQRSHSNISMYWSSKQHILQSRLSQGIGNHQRLISTCASTTPQRWHISTRGGGGGTHSPSLSAIALELWSYVLKIRSWVTATHIPGILDADTASRQLFPDISENSGSVLSPGGRSVCIKANPPGRELCLQISRSGAIAVDAFLQDWSRWKSFIHPPVNLLLRIVKKIRDEGASALVIAPNWPNVPWYPQLAQMLVDYPLQLPTLKSLLYLPFDLQAHHPLWATLNLAIWPVFGDVLKQQDFRQTLSRSSYHHGVSPLRRGMLARGKLGLNGVPCVGGVPFQHL